MILELKKDRVSLPILAERNKKLICINICPSLNNRDVLKKFGKKLLEVHTEASRFDSSKLV